MAKCLRCGAGSEWLDGDAKADTVPRSRYDAQESELRALEGKHAKVVENAKAEIQRLESNLDSTEKERLDLLHRVAYAEAAGEDGLRRWELAEERAKAAENRLDWAREALECLLPGLTLDLRYAEPDDDKDAMRNRIKTVTDALSRIVVEKSYDNPGVPAIQKLLRKGSE